MSVTDSDRVSRKRAQNRESQKKYREKQAARIAELERRLSVMSQAMESSSENGDEGGKQSEIIVKLIAENDQLKGIVRELQRKLGVMSQAVAAALAESEEVASNLTTDDSSSPPDSQDVENSDRPWIDTDDSMPMSSHEVSSTPCQLSFVDDHHQATFFPLGAQLGDVDAMLGAPNALDNLLSKLYGAAPHRQDPGYHYVRQSAA
jgi:hypothetical protein